MYTYTVHVLGAWILSSNMCTPDGSLLWEGIYMYMYIIRVYMYMYMYIYMYYIILCTCIHVCTYTCTCTCTFLDIYSSKTYNYFVTQSDKHVIAYSWGHSQQLGNFSQRTENVSITARSEVCERQCADRSRWSVGIGRCRRARAESRVKWFSDEIRQVIQLLVRNIKLITHELKAYETFYFVYWFVLWQFQFIVFKLFDKLWTVYMYA